MPKGVELVKAVRLVRELPSCRAVAVATARRALSPPQLGTPRDAKAASAPLLSPSLLLLLLRGVKISGLLAHIRPCRADFPRYILRLMRTIPSSAMIQSICAVYLFSKSCIARVLHRNVTLSVTPGVTPLLECNALHLLLH